MRRKYGPSDVILAVPVVREGAFAFSLEPQSATLGDEPGHARRKDAARLSI